MNGKNRLYFCYPKSEYSGFFIIASSRGRAKQMYFWEDGWCDYIDVRCELKKGYDVTKYDEQVLEVGNPILKELDLHYYDEEGNEYE